jgi:hypothetical protein
MLRFLALLLVLLNLIALAWTQGWLGGQARSGERLARQDHPERLQPLGSQAAQQLQRRVCLELGPLEGETARAQAEQALAQAGLKGGSWQWQAAEGALSGGVWGVVTIKMPSKDFQARKEKTYKEARIAFEPLPGFADEQPSLLLSRHPSEAAAEAALAALNQRNYKGLRVLQLQAPRKAWMLRLPQLDGLQLERLQGVKEAPWSQPLRRCEAGAAATPAAPATSVPVASAASR